MRVPLKRLIAATDFSDMADVAVHYGIRLAREFGAKLYLCHVIPFSSTVSLGEAASGVLSQHRHLMDEAHGRLGELIGGVSVEWEPVVRVGNPAEEVARATVEKKADLAVCATHGRSGLKRLFLGSVAERLVRILPCPLLVVRPGAQGLAAWTEGSIRFRKVLLGTDFSADSELALSYALSLAQEFQSELHLVHVVEPPVYKNLLKPGKEEEAELHRLRGLLKEKLPGLVPQDARHWCTPVTGLLAGQPYDELTKYAVVNEIDLIVLGMRGHGLVESLFVGSTTYRVIRQAPCPVLSVQRATWTRQEG
ncbi:MAG: universal stress protein [Thermodesulfobacteriota bacterium]